MRQDTPRQRRKQPMYVTLVYAPIGLLQSCVPRTMTRMMSLQASTSETEPQNRLIPSVFGRSNRERKWLCKTMSLMTQIQRMTVIPDLRQRPERHVTLDMHTHRQQTIQRGSVSIRLCGGTPSGWQRTSAVLGWQQSAVFQTRPILTTEVRWSIASLGLYPSAKLMGASPSLVGSINRSPAPSDCRSDHRILA